MRKALSFACLVLLCLGGAAWAAKPKIAILGLEVIPGPSGAVEPAVTQLARDITTDLRQRVQSDASPYTLAQNSTRELTDEKLLMSCDNEAASCMAVIGAGLSADFLLYGHIEKRGDVYRISVRLLDVKTKSFQTTGEDIPTGTPVATMSKRLYNKVFGKVFGDTPSPTEVVARPRTPIAPPGATAPIDDGAPAQKPRHSPVWKWSLGAGIALALAGGGLAYYSNDQMVNHHNVMYAAATIPGTSTLYSDPRAPDASDCGKSSDEIRETKHAAVTNPGVFDRACTWKGRIYAGYIVGGVGALGAVVSLIMLTREPRAAERSPTGTRTKKSGVAVAPIVRPDAAGAVLSVSW
jgi:TolB-like protein